jgi:hypothetical protein
LCLLRAAKNSGHLRFFFGLFDIRSQNGHVKGLQRLDFEVVILPHKDHKIVIRAQHNENPKFIVIEESVNIGHGQVSTRDYSLGVALSVYGADLPVALDELNKSSNADNKARRVLSLVFLT